MGEIFEDLKGHSVDTGRVALPLRRALHVRKRRSDRDREGRLLSLGLGERRKTCTPTKGIVFGVSEYVRENDCGELIDCAH